MVITKINYDIPKKRIDEISVKTTIVSPKKISNIINGKD
jgi:hypothetical protein